MTDVIKQLEEVFLDAREKVNKQRVELRQNTESSEYRKGYFAGMEAAYDNSIYHILQFEDFIRARHSKEDVEWVVNDMAELGVKIGDQFFFLYKGRSISYADDPTHSEDDPKTGYEEGDPIKWRHVGKREFGECCHPVNYQNCRDITNRLAGAGYTGEESWVMIGTVSYTDSPDWQPILTTGKTDGGLATSPKQARKLAQGSEVASLKNIRVRLEDRLHQCALRGMGMLETQANEDCSSLITMLDEALGALKPFSDQSGWGSAFEEDTPILLSALPTALSEQRMGLLRSDFTYAAYVWEKNDE